MFGWFLTFSSHLSDEMEESLEEKLRRGRREGTFYKWSDDEETSGNEHYNHSSCLYCLLSSILNYCLATQW